MQRLFSNLAILHGAGFHLCLFAVVMGEGSSAVYQGAALNLGLFAENLALYAVWPVVARWWAARQWGRM